MKNCTSSCPLYCP